MAALVSNFTQIADTLHRFANGGVLFSTVTIMIVALISLYSFLLLVKAKFAVPGSFGGQCPSFRTKLSVYTHQQISNHRHRWRALRPIHALRHPHLYRHLSTRLLRRFVPSPFSLSPFTYILSNLAYTIFVAESLQAFILGVTHCLKLFPVQTFILLQVIFFLPMALIRDIAKLSTTALVADVFILAGLVYIFSTEIGIIVESGIADVALFNKKEFPLFIGTAVFSFEGIGLVRFSSLWWIGHWC